MLMKVIQETHPSNEEEKEETMAALAHTQFKYGLHHFYQNEYTES